MLPTPTQPTPTPLTQAQINAQKQAYPNGPVNPAAGYPAGYPAPNYPGPAFTTNPDPAQHEQDRYLTELLNTTTQTVAAVVKRMNESTRGDQETLDLILAELRGLQDNRATRFNQASPNPNSERNSSPNSNPNYAPNLNPDINSGHNPDHSFSRDPNFNHSPDPNFNPNSGANPSPNYPSTPNAPANASATNQANQAGATTIQFHEASPTERKGGHTLKFTGTLSPTNSTLASDAAVTVTSNDSAISPTADRTNVAVPLPNGWVESTATPLKVQYLATSASTGQRIQGQVI